ncbi:gas vesicle protein [Saccharopolyspora spinosa]|uniref:Gas vesicle protein GvpA/GvpJ/GvpM family n=1 Tax=Saccharopolyspora spinosa TaxID=60894 RepID=A0A2N3XY51_SACSN|nr:gas vesicle protein [Saccharopolyspora spinosa]PKW15572.1 gas vesicle protein GvpA/GvpJ/GvpM family [Saccharopolyspora spinosa]
MSAIRAGRDISPLTVRDSREIALVDLLDRLLAGGVVLAGDVTISLAGVDLVRVSLRAIITSIHDVTVDADSWEQVDDG